MFPGLAPKHTPRHSWIRVPHGPDGVDALLNWTFHGKELSLLQRGDLVEVMIDTPSTSPSAFKEIDTTMNSISQRWWMNGTQAIYIQDFYPLETLPTTLEEAFQRVGVQDTSQEIPWRKHDPQENRRLIERASVDDFIGRVCNDFPTGANLFSSDVYVMTNNPITDEILTRLYSHDDARGHNFAAASHGPVAMMHTPPIGGMLQWIAPLYGRILVTFKTKSKWAHKAVDPGDVLITLPNAQMSVFIPDTTVYIGGDFYRDGFLPVSALAIRHEEGDAGSVRRYYAALETLEKIEHRISKLEAAAKKYPLKDIQALTDKMKGWITEFEKGRKK